MCIFMNEAHDQSALFLSAGTDLCVHEWDTWSPKVIQNVIPDCRSHLCDRKELSLKSIESYVIEQRALQFSRKSPKTKNDVFDENNIYRIWNKAKTAWSIDFIEYAVRS